MTIEQAQVYAKLSREDIEKINEGYAKHYDTLVAFANGEEIEYRCSEDDEWAEVAIPSFKKDFAEYRVKPSAEQPAEPWKPKKGETFFYVSSGGKVGKESGGYPMFVDEFYSFGNCFRTFEEANAASKRVRAALKGETISKTETVEPTETLVESLDETPLTDAEKKIIRTLRNYKYEVVGQSEFAFVNDEERLDTNIGVLVVFPYEDDNIDEEFANALRKLSTGRDEAK